MHHIIFATIALTWSTGFFLMKTANPCFGAFTIAGLRCVAGGLILCALWAIKRYEFREIKDWRGLSVLIFFCYLWPYSVQPIVIHRLDSGFVGIVASLIPISTIIVSIPLLRKRPTLRQLLGVAGGLVFTAILMLDKIGGKASLQDLLLAATVPFSYAFGNAWNKRRFREANPVPLACIAMVGGAIVLIPVSLATETMESVSQPAFWKATAGLAALGFLGTGLMTALFYKLIKERGPLYASMVTYIIPIGAVLLGWLAGEDVTGIQLVALVCIIAMVAIAQHAPKKRIDESPGEVVEDG